MNLRWCETDQDGPRWKRSAAIADDGTIFLPAAIVGERNAFMRASYDGISVVVYRKHMFTPVGWMKLEYPKAVDLLTEIEHRIRGFFDGKTDDYGQA
jgi:hypothetical protein